MSITRFLKKRGKWFWGITGVIAVLLLEVVDYLSGHELDVYLFYLLPILLVTWFADGRLGLVMVAASSLAWFIADVMAREEPLTSNIYLWNTFARVLLFGLLVALLGMVKKAYQVNESLANYDYVTGAMSMRYFYELANLEIQRSKRNGHSFSLAYIDLDNFKTVNDRFGHPVGDRTLRAVTECIQRQIRSTDLFARLGGDEFALLLAGAGESEARLALDRVYGSLVAEMQKNGWPVTFSIGVMTYQDMPASVDEMVRLADEAMYKVKTSTKNGLYFDVYKKPKH